MKKLITLAFLITALLLGAITIQAHTGSKKHNKKHRKGIAHGNQNNYGNTNYGNRNYYPIGYRNGHYNRNGVYVFYKQKRVWKYGQKFKNTYKVKVFPSGRKKVKLVKSVPAYRHYGNYGKRVSYKTKIVRYGWKKYRVKYKIIKFRNGRVKKKIVSKKRIYNHYPVNW